MMRRYLPLALLLALAGVAPAAAQGFDMAKGGDSEIQVYADNGIEWVSDGNRVIARGNAKAVRGTMTVTADTLTAHYRQGVGGNEIWRIDAEGNVTIANPTDTATGVKATYDLDKAIFVLKGQPAKLVTPTDTFTAEESLEYWELQRMAVLRGHGVAIQKDKQIESDVLTAHFKDKEDPAAKGKPKSAPAPTPASGSASRKAGQDSSGSLELHYADAYGHVKLTTVQEVVTGDRGDYNMETGIATVSGSVKITREGNELDGGYAHVDLNSGISKLFGAAPGATGDHRARGTFVPEKKDKGGDDGQHQSVFHGNAPKKPTDNSGGPADGQGR